MVSRRTIAFLLGAACIAYGSNDLANAAETDLSKTAGGVTVYLGVVPAEIVKGLPASSGGAVYTVKLTVERSGASPAVLQFKYDHRR